MTNEREQGAATFARIKALREGAAPKAANGNTPPEANPGAGMPPHAAVQQEPAVSAELAAKRKAHGEFIEHYVSRGRAAAHAATASTTPGNDREKGAAAAARLKDLRNRD